MLSVRNSSVVFGGVKALDDVSFSTEDSNKTALIGPNGAGKTTLFNLITGFVTASCGSIHFEDADITGLPPHKVFDVGICRTFQNLNVVANLTLRDNMYLGILGKHKPSFLKDFLRQNRDFWDRIEAEMDTCLEFVGVKEYEHIQAESLPYGILKKFELARAMITTPKLLLLDEPAAGLNRAEKQEFAVILNSLLDSGIKILMVEHDMGFISSICDYVVCLNYGSVIASGSYLDVRNNPDVIEAYIGAQNA